MVQPRSKSTAEEAVREAHCVLVLGPPLFHGALKTKGGFHVYVWSLA